MMKRLGVALAALLSLAQAALGAGTISFSLSQQFGADGKPLANCFLYTIQAGTVSTPQNAFQDSALTIPQPNPMRCDASGRLPQFFLADGLIKVRLTDKNGVNQLYPNGAGALDNILVIGASSGGGGGGTIDPTTIYQTGDLKPRYGTGIHAGWVRANGRTIGSATSGATERANADVRALFEYLWGADPNLAVSGARGVNAAADWVANKTIALPDGRSRALAGLGDMGSTDNAIFSGVTFSAGNSTTLGSVLGQARRALAQANLPNIVPTFTGSGGTANAVTPSVLVLGGGTLGAVGQAGTGFGSIPQGISLVGTLQSSFTPAGTISSINGGVAQTEFDSVSPFLLVTTYIKL